MDKTKTQLLPLTRSQTSLWLTDKLNPNLPINNDSYAFYIHGAINIDAFKVAFQRLIMHSDALRIIFSEEEGVPYQRIKPYLNADLEYLNFTEKTSAEVDEWLKSRSKLVFDISSKLYDSVLIKLNSNYFVWFLNMHHLITDASSRSILFKRMSLFYKEVLKNQETNFIDDYSYKAYIDFENKSRDKNKEISDYWESRIDDFGEKISLYGVKSEIITSKSHRLEIRLSKEEVNTIIQLSSNPEILAWNKNIILFNVFATVLISYMYRFSGHKKLVIGAPIHNRTKETFKNTAGLFIEIFPLAIEIDDNETFFSLLQKVQLETINYLKNGLPGSSSAKLNRSYNVIFNYINSSFSDFANYKTISKWIHPEHIDPGHFIRFQVHDFDNSGEIQLTFDLNASIFTAQNQAESPKHFLKLLNSFTEDYNQEISNISLITDTDIIKIREWNNTNVDYSKDETLLSKFHEQVLKTPNLISILFQDASLTYKALDNASNQVAHFLLQKGIQKNDIVAISLERSLDMLVYIYGIIKAGAAYLPIDTEAPQNRLVFILNDAKAKLLFYNHNKINYTLQEAIDSYHVDSIKDEVILLETSNPNIEVSPDDLAYVIYTSGSTGEPKGVECHHEGICNRLNWMNDDYPINEDDTFLQKTPITFDVSLWELFWPLQRGAKLVIEIPDGHKDPEQLIETIREHQVTNIHFVPSMLNVFTQTKSVETCKSLNRVFCSGEALSVPIVEQAYECLDVEIHNLYGPTEASVDVTSWHCEKEEFKKGIPIGKPVANTRLYILDNQLNQLPIGLVGELYIAGKQVAKGYLNRFEQTKERFIKDIFSDTLDAKMYKTGDLARYRGDGNIEYHGRVDNQVKIRGLRIELGEIERNIEKISNISQAIVTVDSQDNLIAYFTGSHKEGLEIISTLKKQLPDYMIPQFYMHLDDFELLSSGKVDRNKLPDFNTEEKTIRETKIGPTNEIEEVVHEIWKEVLGIVDIGINENFMRIGGNSLKAISITSRLKTVLELELSITDVFNYPTIASYAANVEKTILRLLNE